MPSSYFQTSTYGVQPINLSTGVATDSVKCFGTGLTGVAIASVAPIDLRAEKQTYSLKQVLQVLKAGEIAGGGTLTLTLYTGKTATFSAANEILTATINLAEAVKNGNVLYEITLPSNCNRYVAIGLQKTGTPTGSILVVNKPIR